MTTIGRVGLALAVGLVVFLVLVSTSGAGSRCYSLLTVSVPCEGALAALAGVAAAGVTGVALWLLGRSRRN